MKVTLNLSLSQSLRQRHRLAWSLPVLVIALALLGRLVFSLQYDWHQYRTASQAVAREQGRLGQLAAREADLRQKLDRPESRDLLHEVQFVNSLIDQRQLSFSDLAAKVTALLPPQARLAALSLPDSSGDPLVHFGIEGTTEDAVETFLNNLEESPDFDEVTVTNQGFEEKGTGAPVSITCTARYVGGRTGVVVQHPAAGVAAAANLTPALPQPAEAKKK
jgi:cell division protein FtsB